MVIFKSHPCLGMKNRSISIDYFKWVDDFKLKKILIYYFNTTLGYHISKYTHSKLMSFKWLCKRKKVFKDRLSYRIWTTDNMCDCALLDGRLRAEFSLGSCLQQPKRPLLTGEAPLTLPLIDLHLVFSRFLQSTKAVQL